MASSIVVPSLVEIENYTPEIAEALIDVATKAKADIDSSAVSGAMVAPVANIVALKAIDTTAYTTGTLVLVESDNTGRASLWMFSSTSVVADDTTNQLVTNPTTGGGAWLYQGSSITLKLAISHANSDADTIFTVPTGVQLHPREAWWETSQTFNGTSPKLGVHASPTGWTTKGDILGGATGDTLASTDSRMAGTIGAKLDTRAHGRLIMIAADTFKFDLISGSLSTAGASNVRILCDVLANAGA